MMINKKIFTILGILDLLLIVLMYCLWWSHYDIVSTYPAASVQPIYNAKCVLYAFYATIAMFPLLIVGYIAKKPPVSNIILGVCVVAVVLISLLAGSEIMFVNKAMLP